MPPHTPSWWDQAQQTCQNCHVGLFIWTTFYKILGCQTVTQSTWHLSYLIHRTLRSPYFFQYDSLSVGPTRILSFNQIQRLTFHQTKQQQLTFSPINTLISIIFTLKLFFLFHSPPENHQKRQLFHRKKWRYSLTVQPAATCFPSNYCLYRRVCYPWPWRWSLPFR